MTCIVALTDGTDCWMGGDSFAGNDYHWQRIRDPKVFTMEIDVASQPEPEIMLVGGCGSFRMLQLLQYGLEPTLYNPSVPVVQWLVREFAEKTRELFMERGLAQKQNETEEVFYGAFLIGFRGQLFTIQEDYAVIPFADQEHVTGAGESYALGSLHSTRGRIKSPAKRIELALEAATDLSPMVQRPYHIISTR